MRLVAFALDNPLQRQVHPRNCATLEPALDDKTAAVQGNETLPYFQQQEPNTFVVLGEAFSESLSGIPFAKTPEGAALRDAVQGALERLQQKGVYDEVLAKYGLSANALKPVAVNQGKG